MIPLTVPEIKRLLIAIVWPRLNDAQRAIAWSLWRRRHQAFAQRCHYHAREPNYNAQL